MRTFDLRIATLEKTLLEGKAVHCRARTDHGSIGFEARHEPFLAALQTDSHIEVRDPEGNTHRFAVDDGLLSFAGNRCLILLETHDAEP